VSTPASSTPVANDRLKTREYVGYALGDTASNFFFQTFNIFLTYYYVDVWGITATALLWMMPIVRLVGALDDPIMGLIADRTNTRWGKFRPYLLWGAIPYGICGYLMFAGPDFGPTGKLVYAYITYALMLTSYTIINVPYSSLLGVISPSSRTRTVASSFRFVGAFSGALLISLFVRPLVKHLGGGNEMYGFQMTMAIFAVTSVIMFWITFATTNERVTPPPQQKTNVREELGELFRNWPWFTLLITSVFSTSFVALRSGSTLFYFKYVVGDDGKAIFLGLDRSTVFLTTGALARSRARHRLPRLDCAQD
jgi:glycoside/pentoside/hexuronide:cation symporter, GPH family